MRNYYIFIGVLGVLVIAIIIGGFVIGGTPISQRAIALDKTRLSDFSTIKYHVEDYYRGNQKLPSNLSDLKGTLNIKDPETKKEYSYTSVSGTSYKLCTVFSTDSTKKDDQNNYVYNYNTQYSHPKGYYCFDQKLSDVVTNYRTNNYNSLSSSSVSEDNDKKRLTEMTNLQTAINIRIREATESGSILMCNGSPYPCSGNSLTYSNNPGGSGWVKINFGPKRSLSLATLPYDPLNNGIHHYAYCATQDGWEINAVFESKRFESEMKNDGGDDYLKYEIGSNLNLIGKVPSCIY